MPDSAGVFGLLLFTYVLLGEPLLGLRYYRRLQDRLASDPTSRPTYYLILIAWEWAWLPFIALAVLGRPEPLALLGLRPPGEIGWLLIWIVLAMLLVTTALFRLVPALRRNIEGELMLVAALLPSGRRERWLYAAVSLTAGICEELLYRGFLTYFLTTALPDLSVWVVAAVSSAMFGLAHAYQGGRGILQTGASGLAFAVLFVVSQSLLPAMVLHALGDLRAMFFWPPAEATRLPRGEPQGAN